MRNQTNAAESWGDERPAREERPSQFQRASGFGGSTQWQPLRVQSKRDPVWLKAILIVSLMVVLMLVIFISASR